MYSRDEAGTISAQNTRAAFFDVVGTLIHLHERVGESYARIGARHGLHARPDQLEEGFRGAFHALSPMPIGGQKAWWREVVAASFATAGIETESHCGFDDCFEELFAYFATGRAWDVYGEAPGVLAQLQRAGLALWVVSNFDARLPQVLEECDLARYFHGVVLSSEVGVAKPDPAIFMAAVSRAGCKPADCLHVGDDPLTDWQAARAVGLRVFELRRPELTLRDLLGLQGIPPPRS